MVLISSSICKGMKELEGSRVVRTKGEFEKGREKEEGVARVGVCVFVWSGLAIRKILRP